MENLPDNLKFKILELLNENKNPSAPPIQRPLNFSEVPENLAWKFKEDEVIHQLRSNGFTVIDDFLSYYEESVKDTDIVEVIGACNESLENSSLLPAAIGYGVTRHIDKSVRGDSTRLFSNADLDLPADHVTATMNKLRNRMLSLVPSLSTHLLPPNTALTPKGLQLAYYPGNGEHYHAHRDSSPLNPDRRITILLYVNKDWNKGDGGELRLHFPDKSVFDIEPIANRLIIFRSDLLHQVLPTNAARFAVTMWLYTREPVNLPTLTKPLDISQLSHPTIFVSIPSYRDSETHKTVKSLISTAANPSRLRIGILYQDHEEEDKDLHNDLALPDVQNLNGQNMLQIKTKRISHLLATGPMTARAQIFTEFFANEDFYFQVDSHMRFENGWDDYLVRCVLDGVGVNEEKKNWIVSFYPPSYSLPDEKGISDGPIVLSPKEFDKDGMLRLKGQAMNVETLNLPQSDKIRLIEHSFIASGFLFAQSEAIIKCPPDGTLRGLFFGEEISHSARLWTSGYDFAVPVFGPNGMDHYIAYHLWSRKHRTTWWDDLSKENDQLIQDRLNSQEFVRKLLTDGDSEAHEGRGLGKVRSVKEFETYCKVDFKKQCIMNN
ncbi:Egl nine 3 [Nowakowskiella sp. JEL0407]|nr:Egl nine 3 [Nowakowskiella sp. JEL0407]